MGPQTHKAEDMSKNLVSVEETVRPPGDTSVAALHNRSRLLPPLPCSHSTDFSGLLSESQRSCHEILPFYHGRDLLSNLSKPWVWQSNSVREPHSADPVSHVKLLLCPYLTGMNNSAFASA